MAISLKALKERGFDREAYPNCERFGVWEATVDEAVFSNGSRTKTQGKGARAGLHLYVRAADDGRKYWLYVLYFVTSEVFHRAKKLRAGDQIQMEVVRSQAGHAWIKSLEPLRAAE